MIQCKCAHCGKDFNFKNKRRFKKFCSKSCRYSFQAINQCVPIEQRLLEKVTKTETCWNFTGHKDKDGYGVIHEFIGFPIRKTKMRNIRAHRLSWQIYNGQIPDGMCVCHKCDNPKCVNPDHLFLGTREENTADMVQKQRNIRGNQIWTSKLTPQKVSEIRTKSAHGARQIDLAREYGVDRNTIYRITTRQFWKHVQPIDLH